MNVELRSIVEVSDVRKYSSENRKSEVAHTMVRSEEKITQDLAGDKAIGKDRREHLKGELGSVQVLWSQRYRGTRVNDLAAPRRDGPLMPHGSVS